MSNTTELLQLTKEFKNIIKVNHEVIKYIKYFKTTMPLNEKDKINCDTVIEHMKNMNNIFTTMKKQVVINRDYM